MKNLKRFLKGNKTTYFLVKTENLLVGGFHVKSFEELKEFLSSFKSKPVEILKAIDMYNNNEWEQKELLTLFEKIA